MRRKRGLAISLAELPWSPFCSPHGVGGLSPALRWIILHRGGKAGFGAAPSVQFVDVTRAAGIDFRHSDGASGKKYEVETMGAGCAFLDYNEPNVILVHYDDLVRDLDGEMRRIAGRLGEAAPDDDRWAELVRAATFERMRGRAGWLVPDRAGVLKDAHAFFRRGGSGAGREVLGPDGVARYQQRAAELAPADLLAWLDRER